MIIPLRNEGVALRQWNKSQLLCLLPCKLQLIAFIIKLINATTTLASQPMRIVSYNTTIIHSNPLVPRHFSLSQNRKGSVDLQHLFFNTPIPSEPYWWQELRLISHSINMIALNENCPVELLMRVAVGYKFSLWEPQLLPLRPANKSHSNTICFFLSRSLCCYPSAFWERTLRELASSYINTEAVSNRPRCYFTQSSGRSISKSDYIF